MKTHTKEPWAVCIDPPNDAWYEGVTIYTLSGNKRVADTCILTSEAKANARRIVACVNACAGLHTEILEKLVASGHTLQIGFGQALHAHLSSPQPTIQEPRTNLPKSAFDPYDTIEQQDFIQKGK